MVDVQLNKQVDLTDVMNSNEYGMTPSERLGRFYLSLLTLKQSDRKEVKHYPLDDFAIGDEDVLGRLNLIREFHWFTFNRVVEERIAESGMPLSVLNMGTGKIGEILVCPPASFAHINTEIVDIYPFAFASREEGSDGVKLRTQMNYSVVIR